MVELVYFFMIKKYQKMHGKLIINYFNCFKSFKSFNCFKSFNYFNYFNFKKSFNFYLIIELNKNVNSIYLSIT